MRRAVGLPLIVFVLLVGVPVVAQDEPSSRDVAEALGLRFARPSWRLWWEREADAVLRLRELRRDRDRLPLGWGQREPMRLGKLAALNGFGTWSRFRDVIRAAAEDPDPSVRGEAALALARSPRGAKSETMALLTRLSKDEAGFVRGRACLALGLSRAPGALPALMKLAAADDREFIVLSPDGPLRLVKPLALIALGLLVANEDEDRWLVDANAERPDRDAIRRRLLEELEPADVANREAAVAAVLGLGVAADRAAAPGLHAILKDRAGDPWVRAHAAAALGRCHAREAIPDLLALVDSSDVRMAHGALLGLGELLASDDDDAVDHLMAFVELTTSDERRALAFFALGRSGHPAALRYLTRQSERPDEERRILAERRAAATIALGLAAEAGHELDAAIPARFLERFLAAVDDEDRRPLALALGLLDHSGAVGKLALTPEARSRLLRSLVAQAERTGEVPKEALEKASPLMCPFDGIGTAAVLLNDDTAIPAIRDLFEDRLTPNGLSWGDGSVLWAPLALGVFGDPPSIARMERLVRFTENEPLRDACASGLAKTLLGQKALASMLEPIEVGDRPANAPARAAAVRALGHAIDGSQQTVFSRLRRSANLTAPTPTLVALLGLR